MANLIIKPADGGSLILQDEGGDAALTVGTSGVSTITNASITAGTIGTGVTGFGLVTHASIWRLNTNKAHTAESHIAANLEAADTGTPGTIGAAMTESSGIFTFPATGIWSIKFNAYMRATSAAVAYGEIYIDITTNNSSYTRVATGITSAYATNAYFGSSTSVLFDVTNTTTHKIKFLTGFPASSTVMGNSSSNNTSFTFIRLGDT